jgi:hypothetical protein
MIREVPKREWPSFLQSFSLQHDGWLVSVESIRDGRCEVKASDRPLEGVTVEDAPREIVITVGEGDEPHRFVLRRPRRVRVESDEGVDKSISVEQEDGTIIRVRFRSAIAPELVDGILPFA